MLLLSSETKSQIVSARMVELRKRKAPCDTAPPPTKKANSVRSASSSKAEAALNGSASSQTIVSGSIIKLDGFGGEVETQERAKTNLKSLGAKFRLYLRSPLSRQITFLLLVEEC